MLLRKVSKIIIMTFTAPSRPLSTNESNRMHWAARRRRLKDWGTLTEVAYRHLDSEEKATLKDQKIKVYVHLPFSRKSRRDPHNYVGTNVKAIVDALITAGLAPDDTPEYITVCEPRLTVDSSNVVLICLEPLGKVVKLEKEKK
jgi:hypothetical protein